MLYSKGAPCAPGKTVVSWVQFKDLCCSSSPHIKGRVLWLLRKARNGNTRVKTALNASKSSGKRKGIKSRAEKTYSISRRLEWKQTG